MIKFLKDKKNRKLIITVGILIVIVVVALIIIGESRKKQLRENIPNYFAEKETVKIDCFGDSITYSSNGITYDQCIKTYPEELKNKLLENFSKNTYKVKNIEVKNLGIPGDWILPDSYKRLSGDADIIIMLYGINNVFQNQPYKEIIKSNIEEIKKTGAKLYLVLYPICPGNKYMDLMNKINDYIVKVAKETGEELIDPNKELSKIKNLKEYFVKDGIHFTPDGYEIFGKIIADYIYNDYKR